MTDRPIAILGAGMAGFGAANRLADEGVRATLYEARDAIGGHTSTHVYGDGFTHVLAMVERTTDALVEQLPDLIES